MGCEQISQLSPAFVWTIVVAFPLAVVGLFSYIDGSLPDALETAWVKVGGKRRVDPRDSRMIPY